MYFHYESGYDPRDLVAQFHQEKRVAKDIGLTQRRHFLGLMENLVCHFHGISNGDKSITPTHTLARKVYKYQCSASSNQCYCPGSGVGRARDFNIVT